MTDYGAVLNAAPVACLFQNKVILLPKLMLIKD